MLGAMTLHAFLELPDGIALRVEPAGLLVGRHHSCDLQLVDETASRRHAIVRITGSGVELIVLGRHPVLVDGKPCAQVTALAPGAELGFPGCTCRLRVDDVTDSTPVVYCLRRGNDRFPIRSTPFVAGSGASAHVVVAGWPEEALRFQLAQGELYVEVTSGAGSHGGDELPASVPVALALGDEVGYQGATFRIEQAGDGNTSTAVGGRTVRASAALLEPLPRGGRLTLTFPDGDRTVYLPGRRFRLMSALLAPPSAHRDGDYVPDSEIIPYVWNDDDEVGGRQDINVLITRCRQDLVAAGIAAAGLLERAPGGRATRVVLAPNAKIRTAAA